MSPKPSSGEDGAADSRRISDFVWRARRVAAHSFAQDTEQLESFASGKFTVDVDYAGSVKMTQHLPPDEEKFESLVSRLRPFTLRSESIYYEKVLVALERKLTGVQGIDSQRAALVELRSTWDNADFMGSHVQAYSSQLDPGDGSGPTPVVSDSQLAAGWLYGDLVHFDLTGPKLEAQAFDLEDRYRASVSVYSRIALLTLETLRFIEGLRTQRIVELDEAVWDSPVVIGRTTIVTDGTLHVAPIGTVPADLASGVELGPEWQRFTALESLRIQSDIDLRLVLTHRDGSEICYDAAITGRRSLGTRKEIDILFASCAVLTLALELGDETILDVQVSKWRLEKSTNTVSLEAVDGLLAFFGADRFVLAANGDPFITGGSVGVTCEHETLGVAREVLSDLVKIELCGGTVVGGLPARITPHQRITLRRTRRMWEGYAVPSTSHPVTVTSRRDSPPRLVAEREKILELDRLEVHVPVTYMAHPSMEVSASDAQSDDDATQKYLVTPPTGERFVSWFPSSRLIENDDGGILLARWDLAGIDEETYDY